MQIAGSLRVSLRYNSLSLLEGALEWWPKESFNVLLAEADMTWKSAQQRVKVERASVGKGVR